MDFLTIDTLRSVGGAALAVSVVTAVVKKVSSITGRETQIAAAAVSLAIAIVIGDWHSLQSGTLAALNGFVIFAAAVGIDQTLNYGR